MKHLLTAVLAVIVLALASHLGVVALRPALIASSYPAAIARIYAAKAQTAQRQATVQLVPVSGRPGISRVVLTPAAVQHIGIETGAIELKPVARVRLIGSRIVDGTTLPAEAPAAARAAARVAVIPLSGRSDEPAPGIVARVFPLRPSPTVPAAVPSASLVATIHDAGKGEAEGVAYYVLDAAASGLETGELVKVEMPLAGTGAPALVVPETAVIYEPQGTAWVYANPEPNVFVREPIVVETSHGGVSVLSKGPPPGTRIATVGAFEIYGAESSIGIEKVGNQVAGDGLAGGPGRGGEQR